MIDFQLFDSSGDSINFSYKDNAIIVDMQDPDSMIETQFKILPEAIPQLIEWLAQVEEQKYLLAIINHTLNSSGLDSFLQEKSDYDILQEFLINYDN